MSRWNLTERKCFVCKKNFADCKHTNADEENHRVKMSEKRQSDKSIEKLVKKLVDQALKERGL